MKHIDKSIISVVTVIALVKISVADEWVCTTTILDTILIHTLNIVNNSLCGFLVTFARILHELGNQTNSKREVWSTVRQINKATDQLSIFG